MSINTLQTVALLDVFDDIHVLICDDIEDYLRLCIQLCYLTRCQFLHLHVVFT